MQRAQVSRAVVGKGFGIEGGVGDVGAGVVAAAAVFEMVGTDDDVVFVERVWFKGSLMAVRVSAGFASDGFVREREGGWICGRYFCEEGRFELGGGVFSVVVAVVEAFLVMRRGQGTRLHSCVLVEMMEVSVGGWTEGVERLWERTHIGWLRRIVM